VLRTCGGDLDKHLVLAHERHRRGLVDLERVFPYASYILAIMAPATSVAVATRAGDEDVDAAMHQPASAIVVLTTPLLPLLLMSL
jgi:hypothetical protein